MTVIREIRPEEIPVLNDFLYEAIFVPESVPAPPRSIIENEDLQVYVRDFGKKTDDRCLVAEVNGKIVGALQTKRLYVMSLNISAGMMWKRGILCALLCAGVFAIEYSSAKRVLNSCDTIIERLKMKEEDSDSSV